ncbi:PII-like signaling protein [Dysgonomonas hofstadii]|uniref:PII-like signaling protein n=1 Tax=Dysgonomonas hofstadii TaxID=637886 RepID=A0A840CUI1_9BACT|nr:DUF190 domain-containing protein [Dysgonomonas hofstadii]MBB4035383.1 PII-like signaling protein [Dysgonomonas hofstadii]
MTEDITIRFYFEHGKKVKGLSFFKKLFHHNFSHFMIKEAKQEGIKQAICFNIPAGYLSHHKNIQWGHAEVTPLNHPQCIELTDNEDKIMAFLQKHRDQLSDTEVIIVKSEIQVLIF